MLLNEITEEYTPHDDMHRRIFIQKLSLYFSIA